MNLKPSKDIVGLSRSNIRMLLKKNKGKGASDPPRFPKVSNEFEGQFKKNFAKSLQRLLGGITKDMIDIKSKKDGKGKV